MHSPSKILFPDSDTLTPSEFPLLPHNFASFTLKKSIHSDVSAIFLSNPLKKSAQPRHPSNIDRPLKRLLLEMRAPPTFGGVKVGPIFNEAIHSRTRRDDDCLNRISKLGSFFEGRLLR
jgi:hypothetical protein